MTADLTGQRVRDWLLALPGGRASRVYVVCDFDGDGLSAGALLMRAMRGAGYSDVAAESRRKGESAWGAEIGERLRHRAASHGVDALILADLGSRDGVILEDVKGEPSRSGRRSRRRLAVADRHLYSERPWRSGAVWRAGHCQGEIRGRRAGWVHFSARGPAGINLIEFLARHRPSEADDSYGMGHDQASGGALPVHVWNRWIHEMGFGDDMQVNED